MAGSDTQSTSSSVSAFISTLIPNLVIFAVFLGIFIALRKKQLRVYEPRTSVKTVPKDLRPDETPRGLFSWLSHVLSKPESFLIQQAGVDGYFFVRFLFGFASICFLGCCILWPVLFPVNAVKGNGQQGFDILSYSNVRDDKRVYAHVFLSWIYFGCVIFFIYREMVYYTTFRHVLQTTPLYDSLISSRTLLLTEIPETLYEEIELRTYFPTATNLWYSRNYKDLQEKVKERTKLAKKYEGVLNKTIKKSVKLRLKAQKKNKPVPEPADDINKYLKDGKKRPTHKLKFLIGKKVDTLNYCPEKLGDLNTDIKKDQAEFASNDQLPGVFIEFPTQLELQEAYQAIPYNSDLKKCKRITNVAPDDVIWENLCLTPTTRRIKKAIATTVLTLMIIFWSIPVAVVGAISNINFLTDKVPFLRFINNMPPKLLGIITGLLPVVALAILMSLVPPFIKKMGKVSGCLTIQEVEGYCQSWFYAFQVVHVFLTVTVASAAASTVTKVIADPTSALNLLGERIPPASNFYIAYFCLQGLAISSGLLCQLVALILAQFLGKILDSTPRQKWSRYSTLKQPGWAVIYPLYQLLGSIAIIYAIIQPLILGFAFLTFVFVYGAYLYSLTYVFTPNVHDARGRNYPRSLFQLYVGIYLAEVCLIALFVFKKNWACVALEGVCLAASAVAHVYMKRKFLPLFDIVPISAIKYAGGDETFAYPMHDQGKKEVKIEGENYWEGGNQLGLVNDSDKSEHVSGTTNEPNTLLESNTEKDLEKDPEKNNIASKVLKSPNDGVSWLKRFFKPKTETFDLIRKIMPDAYFNYINYSDEFLAHAYSDPSVQDEEPHIWIARDEMGLSEIEKNKAIQQGVDVDDSNATFDEKGNIEYTGPPPSYEESIRK